MSAKIKKGMILSAGLGTRLNPITQSIPKPLISVLNTPNILYVLFLLKRAGIRDVVINLFHLPKKIEQFFIEKKYLGMNYFFTHEDPILGTGGGLKNAEPFLKDCTFVLANCDFVSNLDIAKSMERHFIKRSMASMLLTQDDSRQHLYSKVGIAADETLVSLPKLQTKNADHFGIFTGIHILDSRVLDFLEHKPCGINDVLYPKLMKEFSGAVHGFIDHNAFWCDTGDLPAFLQTNRFLLERLQQKDPLITDLFKSLETPYTEMAPGVWVEEGGLLPKNVTFIGPILLGKNISFGNSVTVGPFAILGQSSILGDHCTVTDSVLLNGAEIVAGAKISHVVQFKNISLSAKTIV